MHARKMGIFHSIEIDIVTETYICVCLLGNNYTELIHQKFIIGNFICRSNNFHVTIVHD